MNEEIKIKQSKILLIFGIIMLVIAAKMAQVAISTFMRTGKINFGLVFYGLMVCVPAIVGVVCIYDWRKSTQRMRDILEKYGEDNIIANIRQHSIYVYQENEYADKVYFTDRFVVEATTAIIPYGEISWMYKDITKYQKSGITRTSVAFALLDGSKFFLCHNVKDKELEDIMYICQQHNPNIIFGYSPETEKQHEVNVKRYKDGLNQIEHEAVATETMRKSNEYMNGRNKLVNGISGLLCSILLGLLSAFGLNDLIGEEVKGVMIATMVVLGMISSGVLVTGLKKMKDAKKK